MAVTVASFRAAFPVFVQATYPDPQVQFWLDLGAKLVGPRWFTLGDYGVMLFAAHNLSMDTVLSASAGQAPGQVLGPMTGAHVDKVGYTRDGGAALLPGAGHWNLSTYGLRFKQMVRMVGAGPVQVGAPSGGNCNAGAWPGPWQYNFPNPS